MDTKRLKLLGLGWHFLMHLGYFRPKYQHYFGTVSPLFMGKCSWIFFLQKMLVFNFRLRWYRQWILKKCIKRKFLVNDHATFLFPSILFHDSSKFKIFINEKFWKIFNYVAHDIANEFWKNSHFQNKTTGFLLRWQNSLRYEISLICHWNIDSLNKIGLLFMLWSQMVNKMSSRYNTDYI